MLSLYYTTEYHPDGYMVASITYITLWGDTMPFATRTGWDPETVRSECLKVIERWEA